MADLQARGDRIVYLDDNGDSVYNLPENPLTLDGVLIEGDSSNRDITVGNITANNITVGNITANTTGYIQLPVGNDSDQRPESPQEGMLRFNSILKALEFYNGTAWLSVNPVVTALNYVGATFRYNAQDGVGSTISVPVQSNAEVGDLLVIYAWTDTNVAQTTPSGWTYVGNTGTGEYPRGYAYVKKATGNDLNNNVNISLDTSDNRAYISTAFRPNNPFNSFEVSNAIGTKGPNALSLTLNNTGVNKPSIAIAGLTGRTGPQQPTLTWNSKDAQVQGGENIPTLAYNIYNTTDNDNPATHSMSTDDTGRQSLLAFYIEFD